MKRNAKKIAAISGIAIGAATAALSVTSFVTTDFLVGIALDRKTPKITDRTEKMFTGRHRDKAFSDAVTSCAAKLSAKKHELVEITAEDGIKLKGHWFQADQPKRVMIAMHGWRSNWDRDFGMIADMWLDNGCSVLFAEQRGQNGSGGDHMGFGLTERFDCRDWARWTENKVEGEVPIYLCGLSMGATTVLMAAGLDLSPRVHGIVADCGFTSPHDIWKHVATKNLHISYSLHGPIADTLCRRRIALGSSEYSTVDALRNTVIPVMLIHGADDHFVPVQMTYENYKACASPKRLLIVPGADHGMSYYVDKKLYESELMSFWKQYD